MGAEASPAIERPGHPRAVAALLVLATLVSFVGVFSIWINRQALNTDNWVNTSDQLLQNEQVQEQLSIFLANELFANVNVQAELQKALPPRLAPLAGPAAGGLHQLAPQVAQKVLATPQVQSLWSDANRAAHEALLKILDGGGSTVSTGGGEVTLDLGSLVAQIGAQLGVGGKIASKVPAGAGEMTILKSDQLSAAQSIAKLIRRAPVVLTLLALLLYGLAVYLAGPRRRQALRSVGFSLIVAGAVALIVRGIAAGYVVDALAGSASVRPAAEAVWEVGTSLLVTVADSAIAFGILLVIGAWLAGSTRAAVALRREASPYVREHRAGAYAVAGAVYLALIAWAPIAAFHKPLGIALFAVLLGCGAELLRRQILREFPGTHAGRLGERLRGAGRGMSAALAGRSGPQAAPAGAGTAGDKVGQLERLASLHDSGDLSDEEFASAKAAMLGAGPSLE
jgi:lipoprotein signal peptidase